MAIGGTKVVQVTNIAPQATKDQMQTLFGYLGKIDDIRLYPTIRDVSCPVQSRICYIKFMESSTVGIAQHMTNTVFIDRALIVIPVQNGDIPDEYFALEMTRNGTIVPGLCAAEPNLPAHVVNSVTNLGAGQVIVTYDPKLEASGLPSYPPLPSNYDSHKIEEIRRTLLMIDIDPSIPSEEYIDFFAPAGEVKYMRQCTRASDNNTHLLLEFNDQPSIIEVLKMNGKEFQGKPIKIVHATQAIVKPQAKSNEAAQKEIEEAMSSRRSRSRSRGRRRRSRSRSRSVDPDPDNVRAAHDRDQEDRSLASVNIVQSLDQDVVLDHVQEDRIRTVQNRVVQDPNPDLVQHVPNGFDIKARKGQSRGKSLRKRRNAASRHEIGNVREKEIVENHETKNATAKLKRKELNATLRPTSKKNAQVKNARDQLPKVNIDLGRAKDVEPGLGNADRVREDDDIRLRRVRAEGPDLRAGNGNINEINTSRNYDEEERGYDSERSKRRDYGDGYDLEHEKDSPEKSDNMDISNSP
ncbi:hypothetical protein FQR65_LT05857 [Abscondita terminalis]|nr:hypothetical protein FQR65_LT05857 [Abscondita terminalis]